MVIAGRPKAGKSFMALEMAMSLVQGTSLIGVFPVSFPCTVALIQSEIAPGLFYPRLAQAAKSVQHQNSCLDRFYLQQTCTFKLDREPDVLILKQELASMRPHVLIVDPLYMMRSGSENLAEEMSKTTDTLSELGEMFNMATVIVHHYRKQRTTSSGKPIAQDMDDIRGSSVIRAWADSTFLLSRQKGSSTVDVDFEFRHFPDVETLRTSFHYTTPFFDPVAIPGVLQIVKSLSGSPKVMSQIVKETGLHHRVITATLSNLIAADLAEVDGQKAYCLRLV